jgi:hypothetical protein
MALQISHPLMQKGLKLAVLGLSFGSGQSGELDTPILAAESSLL